MKCPVCKTDEYYEGFNVRPGEGECVNIYCRLYNADHAEKSSGGSTIAWSRSTAPDYEDLPETDPEWQNTSKSIVEQMIEEILKDGATLATTVHAVGRAYGALLGESSGLAKDPRAPRGYLSVPMDCSQSVSRPLKASVERRMLAIGQKLYEQESPKFSQTKGYLGQWVEPPQSRSCKGSSIQSDPLVVTRVDAPTKEIWLSSAVSTMPEQQLFQSHDDLHAKRQDLLKSLEQCDQLIRRLQSAEQPSCSGRPRSQPQTPTEQPSGSAVASGRTSDLSDGDEDHHRWCVLRSPELGSREVYTTLSAGREKARQEAGVLIDLESREFWDYRELDLARW